MSRRKVQEAMDAIPGGASDELRAKVQDALPDPQTVTVAREVPPEGDGPTHVKPIPPPPDPDAPIKRKRGRPPGSTNKKTETPAGKAIVALADVKKQLVVASATVAAMGKGGKWSKLANSLGWHKEVEIVQDGAPTQALAASDRLDLSMNLMGPYMEESGMLSAASLSNEGKMAIGLCILLGPSVVAGFGMLAEWAFKRPKAKDAMVKTSATTQPCASHAACREVEGILQHVHECERHPMRADPSAERN